MKKLIMITAFLAASVANAQLPSYTLANVAAHATATDCWMVLNTTKVYNFTPFVSMIPAAAPWCPIAAKTVPQVLRVSRIHPMRLHWKPLI